MPITVHINNRRDPRNRYQLHCETIDALNPRVQQTLGDISILVGRKIAKARFHNDFPNNT